MSTFFDQCSYQKRQQRVHSTVLMCLLSMIVLSQNSSRRLTATEWIFPLKRMTIIYNRLTPVTGRREDRILRSAAFNLVTSLLLRDSVTWTWRKTANLPIKPLRSRQSIPKMTLAKLIGPIHKLSECTSLKLVSVSRHSRYLSPALS